MFDRILIGLDGSREARQAGSLGLGLAERLGARVTGLSVIDVRIVEGPAVETLAPLWGEVTGRPFQPELLRLYRERADATLGDFAASIESAGMAPIEQRVEIGVAEDTLLDLAADADLLVMGRRGEHAGFGKRSLGATLLRVLHRAPCPVLVATDASDAPVAASPPSVTSPIPTRPVVAWDRGPGAAGALALAADYCRHVGARLGVVHAGDESHDECMEEVHAVLARADVSWESARIEGPPARAVADALARWDADCLFMGAFGRGRVRDFFFGSNTVEILEGTSVPVFACR